MKEQLKYVTDLKELKEKTHTFFARDFHQLPPFDPLILDFCDAFSQKLSQLESLRTFPDFAALAFWLRKGHLHELQKQFLQNSTPTTLRTPRGLVFHIPPANIDVMFIYSWITSLLVGNGNIIRRFFWNRL